MDDVRGLDDAVAAVLRRDKGAFDGAMSSLRTCGKAGFALFLERICDDVLSNGLEDRSAIRLTSAEESTLRALADGLSNQAIADLQNRSLNTVKTHVASVLRKLGAQSRGEAVAAARRRGLLSD